MHNIVAGVLALTLKSTCLLITPLEPVNEKNVSLYHFTIHHFFHIPDLFPTFAPLL